MRISIVFAFIITLVFACGGEQSVDGSKLASSENGAKQNQVDPFAMEKKTYQQACLACHGADGKLGINGATDLMKSISGLKSRIKMITEGNCLMTPFKGILSMEEMVAVAKYTIQLRKESKK